MKILMACEDFLPSLGGAEIHIDNLIRNLLALGHEVVFLTHQPGVAELDARIEIKRIGRAKKFLPQIWNFLWQQSGRADLLHTHYCHRLGFLMGLIGRLRGKPVIVTLHGYGILDHPGHNFRQKFTHSLWRFLSLKLCTHVISTSQDLAQVARKYIAIKKVTVIPNGYDQVIFHPNVKVNAYLLAKYRDKKIILTVRRLVPKTGIQYLIEALPQVIQNQPALKYLAIGDGAMRPFLEKRIRDLGLRDRVELLGAKANAEVPQYLRLADVVVFPSTAESTSLACAESMAMGKKIVASRVGGLIELIGTNQERGWLVDLVPWQSSSYNAPGQLPADRYQRLAQALSQALSEVSDSRSQAAKTFAEENLSRTKVTNSTLEIFHKFLSR